MIYNIGDLIINSGEGSLSIAIEQLPGFRYFKTDLNENKSISLNFSESTSLGILLKNKTTKLIYYTTTDISEIFFYRDVEQCFLMKIHDKDKHLILKCHPNSDIAELEGDWDHSFLKYALWCAYGIRGLSSGRIPIHASAVEYKKRSYLFLGESGTGKSTHARHWTENIPGCKLLNDDSPIVSCADGNIMIYGSPWSGKTHCYKNERYKAHAFTRLSQYRTNEIYRLDIAHSFAALHPSMPPAFCYDDLLCNLLTRIESCIITKIPIYMMKCLPNPDAAFIAHKFLE